MSVDKYRETSNGSTARPEQGGPRALSDIASRVLEPVIARRAGMTIDLVAAWAELAGPRHVGYSMPERIIWPRRAHEDDPFQPGTLVVACEGNRAVWLQHEAGEIIERLNIFFGFQAVGRLRIVQKPVRRLDPPARLREPELDAASRRHLDELLAGIEEGPLRRSLARLGTGILSRERRRPARK